MSRCFPFPPPGYEKKTRIDDVNFLKKESDKGKKHKKEKKSKEKKEKKEKREKDRSVRKHGDKKEETEKHREKKKDKEKERDQDKDKETINVADEKKIPVQNKAPNADIPIEKEHKLKDKNSIFREKLRRTHTGSNEENVRENADSVKENKDSKFIQDLDSKINYDGSGTQMSHKFPVTGDKKDEATVRVMAKGNTPWPEVNERDKDKIIDGTKIDGLGISVDTQHFVNAIVPNHAGIFQPTAKPSEKNFENMQESKESIKENRGDKKQGDKLKDRDKGKKERRKNKDRDKEKKKEEKSKEQVEHKTSEHSSKSKESNKFDPFCINSSSQPPKDNFKKVVGDQNLKKRKGFEPNGFLHANDNWPNKLPRPPSHPLSENGSLSDPRQISVSCRPDRQEAATNLEVDYKERKVNGIIEARLISAPTSKPVSGTTSANQVAAVSVRSPHPDTKYLKQVYSVPQMDTWCELDDQGWLFNRSSLQQSKPRVESSDTGETPLVYADALQIKHVDVYALPYVIPY